MQTSVLLSIKPEYAGRIFDGSKRFEFRRKVFRNPNVKTVVVYATAPISRVIGEFDIEDIMYLGIDGLWERTKEQSGIEKHHFYAYFNGREHGYAIRIGQTRVYAEPLDLQVSFQIKHPPQFFVYLNDFKIN
jgi:predicted transcriptional regulator